MSTLYDTDFYAWCCEQAAAIREGRWEALDREHLEDEVASLGRWQAEHAGRCLQRILEALLKGAYAPLDWLEHRCRWQREADRGRLQLQHDLEDSPSLQDALAGELAHAYDMARLYVLGRLDLDEIALLEQHSAALPETCPWTLAEIQQAGFFPDMPTPTQEPTP